jgi:hypothetical protein
LFATKLKFTSSPTEKTTAITDILLSLMAAGGIVYLQRLGTSEVWKINTWSWAFAFIALSGLLGAIAHGCELPETAHQRIWNLLNLGLGLAVSVFVIGVAYDLWGPVIARKILPWMLARSIAFCMRCIQLVGDNGSIERLAADGHRRAGEYHRRRHSGRKKSTRHTPF